MKPSNIPKQKLFLNRPPPIDSSQNTLSKIQNISRKRGLSDQHKAARSKTKVQKYSSIKKEDALRGIDCCPLNINSMVRCFSLNYRKKPLSLSKRPIMTIIPSVEDQNSTQSIILHKKSDQEARSTKKQSDSFVHEQRRMLNSKTISLHNNIIIQKIPNNSQILSSAGFSKQKNRRSSQSRKNMKNFTFTNKIFSSHGQKGQKYIIQGPTKNQQASNMLINQRTVDLHMKLQENIDYPFDEISFSQFLKQNINEFPNVETIEKRLNIMSKEIQEKEEILAYLTVKQHELSKKIQTYQSIIAERKNQLIKITNLLEEIRKEKLQMVNFLQTQPNRILQAQAIGYKQKEQQLFDLACFLQSSNHTDLSYWIAESTLVPRQNFNYTLKSLTPFYETNQSTISFELKQLAKIKRSLLSSHERIVNIIQTNLEAKCKRIKEFTQTMRKLASYTIGKREYLAQVNQEMIITSALVLENIERLKANLGKTQDKYDSQRSSESEVYYLTNIYDLCVRMKRIYNEAEIFY